MSAFVYDCRQNVTIAKQCKQGVLRPRDLDHYKIARVYLSRMCDEGLLKRVALTTQIPSSVWVAVEHKSRAPKINYPPIRLIRFSKRLFDFGVQIKQGITSEIRVYSPAKTVADCFRFRNKIGLDVAIEALKDCRRKKAATNDELWEAAKVCRMSKVMKPYMEAVV